MLCELITEALNKLNDQELLVLARDAKNFSDYSIPPVTIQKISYPVDLSSACYSLSDFLPGPVCSMLNEVMQGLKDNKDREIKDYVEFKKDANTLLDSKKYPAFLKDVLALTIADEKKVEELLNKMNKLVTVLKVLAEKLPNATLNGQQKIDHIYQEFSVIKNALEEIHHEARDHNKNNKFDNVKADVTQMVKTVTGFIDDVSTKLQEKERNPKLTRSMAGQIADHKRRLTEVRTKLLNGASKTFTSYSQLHELVNLMDEACEAASRTSLIGSSKYDEIKTQLAQLKKTISSSQLENVEQKEMVANPNEKALFAFQDIIALESQRIVLALYNTRLVEEKMKPEINKKKAEVIVKKTVKVCELSTILDDEKLTLSNRRKEFDRLLNDKKATFTPRQNGCFQLFKKISYDQVIVNKLEELALAPAISLPHSNSSFTVR